MSGITEAIQDKLDRQAIVSVDSVLSGFTAADLADMATILEEVAAHFNVSQAVIKGTAKPRNIVDARWTWIYLISHFCGLRDNAIARLLGLDHTSVSHAIRRTKELMQVDPAFFRRVSGAQSRVAAKLEKKV